MRALRRVFALALATLLLGWLAHRALFPSSLPEQFTPAPIVTAPVKAPSETNVSGLAADDAVKNDAGLRRHVAELSAEFDRLRTLPDDIETFRRSADLENEFAALLDSDTAAFLVRSMPAGFVDSHFGVISLNTWAGSNRAAAAAWMAQHPGATASSAEALARGWLSADPAGLQAHLDQLTPGAWRDNLSVTSAEDAFLARQSDVVLALLDHATPDNARRRQLAEWNTTAWAKSDPTAAAAWATREPDPARRQTLLAAVAIGQANTDPAAAGARLLKTVTEPAALGPALQAVVRLWTVRDAEAASVWVASLREGTLRQEAEEGLLAIATPDTTHAPTVSAP